MFDWVLKTPLLKLKFTQVVYSFWDLTGEESTIQPLPYYVEEKIKHRSNTTHFRTVLLIVLSCGIK